MDDGPKREFFFCSVDYVNKSCKTGVNIDTIANLNKDFCVSFGLNFDQSFF